MSELGDIMFKCVQEHSGGMKLTELIAVLEPPIANRVEFHELIDAAKAHPKLAVLTYGWDMGDGDGDASGHDNTGGLIREKLFIYTPLPPEVACIASEDDIHQAQLAKDACMPGSPGTTS